MTLEKAPMAQWARKLRVLYEFEPESYSKIIYVAEPDISAKLRADLRFRKDNDRNAVFQIKGPTGSGKSNVACAVARWIIPDWRPRGHEFFDSEELIRAARKAKGESVFVKDEDPRRHGAGTIVIDDMMANIESAVARWAHMYFLFVNPYETGHLIHFVLDTSREEAEYSSPGVMKAVAADVQAWAKDRWLDVGKVKIDFEKEGLTEDIIAEYKEVMVDFKSRMKLTGGAGTKAQVLATYEYLWDRKYRDNLIDDPEFRKIPLSRDGRLTGKHAYYITRANKVFREDADLIVLFKGSDLIGQIGIDKFAGYKPPK